MAAQALHMTQPAVTMQVQSLEDFFGTKLFYRSTKKIELTESGLALLPHAQHSVELMQKAVSSMSAYMHHLKGQLSFGASMTVGEYVLPRFLGLFSRTFSDITIQLKVMNTTQLVAELLSHHLPFALVEAPVYHPDIVTQPVLNDELVLVLPPDHPLAATEQVKLADALQYPLILREKGSGTRQVLEQRLALFGADLESMNVTMELASTGAIKSAVEAGLGLSFLSPYSIHHEIALGLLVKRNLAEGAIPRHFYSAMHKSTLLPVPALTFLHFLREQTG